MDGDGNRNSGQETFREGEGQNATLPSGHIKQVCGEWASYVSIQKGSSSDADTFTTGQAETRCDGVGKGAVSLERNERRRER
jgi:hypothetical protein